MSKTFKAELLVDISYEDFAGHTHTHEAGTVVEVYKTDEPSLSIDINGLLSVEAPGILEAVEGDEHFVIKPFQIRPSN